MNAARTLTPEMNARMHRQSTLNEAIDFKGIGLHTGCPVEMIIRPAPPNTGIVFRRSDLNDFPIEAQAAHIANVSYATTLMKKGVLISTVEHVLSALYAMAIDNAFIDVDNLELPILDSSARPSWRGSRRWAAGCTTSGGAFSGSGARSSMLWATRPSRPDRPTHSS